MSTKRYAVRIYPRTNAASNLARKFLSPKSINTDYIFSTEQEAQDYASATCDYLREINNVINEANFPLSFVFRVGEITLPVKE